MNLAQIFTNVMVDHCNRNNKVDEALLCKEVAEAINKLPRDVYFTEELNNFIDAYGEAIDENYVGRDEYGEKQYHVYNEETHWNGRITRELRAMGFYKKHEAWALLETV